VPSSESFATTARTAFTSRCASTRSRPRSPFRADLENAARVATTNEPRPGGMTRGWDQTLVRPERTEAALAGAPTTRPTPHSSRGTPALPMRASSNAPADDVRRPAATGAEHRHQTAVTSEGRRARLVRPRPGPEPRLGAVVERIGSGTDLCRAFGLARHLLASTTAFVRTAHEHRATTDVSSVFPELARYDPAQPHATQGGAGETTPGFRRAGGTPGSR
jgi:hypothetical protein